MSWLGFGSKAPSATIIVALEGAERRRRDGGPNNLLLYYDGETVKGQVTINLKPTKVIEHYGIKIEFVGAVEMADSSMSVEFTCLVRELAPPGTLSNSTTYPFEYLNVEKMHESYNGLRTRLRYYLRVTITRRMTDIVKEYDIWVHTLHDRPDNNKVIRMEVGVEDALHIEFEYKRSKYHLRDAIVGKIFFVLVRIKVKVMELAIIRKETLGAGKGISTETQTVTRFEIMDGAPVKGESIPIRLFLAGFDLTPSMTDICKRFSVRYYLNLVLIDEDDRRYFKQQEITLWRKK
eukprot:CFRG2805T1